MIQGSHTVIVTVAAVKDTVTRSIFGKVKYHVQQEMVLQQQDQCPVSLAIRQRLRIAGSTLPLVSLAIRQRLWIAGSTLPSVSPSVSAAAASPFAGTSNSVSTLL